MIGRRSQRGMTLIAHIDSETGFSGGEVQVFLLIDALAKRGYENVLVCPRGSRAEEEANSQAIRTFDVRLRNDLDVVSVFRLARWLRRSGADLVHLHTGRATWLGGLAAKLAGVPAITTRRMDRRVSRGLRTKLMYGSLVQRTVAISPAVRDCLLEANVAADSIELIWDAVDPHDFEPSAMREATRTELGLSENEFVLISMAALVRRKGIDVLIDAAALLVKRGIPVRVLIGGEGEERVALEAQAKRLGVESQVSFLGWRSDKANLLAASDVFVLPSRAEGVGVAALEAMAAEKAVVASRVGGLSQAVVDGETGSLVEAGDPAALAEALEALAGDSTTRDSLGKRGRERVLKLFSIESQASQYIETYNRVLTMKGTS